MIYPGTEVRIIGAFVRIDTGRKIDPTTVSLEVIDPQCVKSTYTYSAAQIVRDGLGDYHYDLTIPGSASSEGKWHYRWICTGAAIGVTEGRFNVKCSAFTG